LKIGNVSFDGTKVNANASKHKAMSYAHASKLEQKIKEEEEVELPAIMGELFFAMIPGNNKNSGNIFS